jgi:hypothetical protein
VFILHIHSDFALSISESYQESLLLKAKQKQLEDDRRMAEFLASENLTFAEDDNANWSSHTPLFTIVRPPVFESSVSSSDTDTDTDIEQSHEEENQKRTPKKRKSSAGKRNKAAPSIKAERKQKQKEHKEQKERKENLKSKGKGQGTKRKLSQKARDEIEGHLGKHLGLLWSGMCF